MKFVRPCETELGSVLKYLARNVCEKTLNAQGFPIMDSSEKLEAVTHCDFRDFEIMFHDVSCKNMRQP